VGGFPFDVRLEQPNKETVAAMLEAECITHDLDVKRYSDVEEALWELKR
jgi:DNA-damage-inducible protein J